MPCEDWFYFERRYRLAVHTYCDAVDRLDSTRDFDNAWQRIESARISADHARSVLLRHQQMHLCVPMQTSPVPSPQESSDAEANELILGNLEQPGG